MSTKKKIHGNTGRKRPYLSDRNRTHNMSRTPEYVVWSAMKKRCVTPNQKDLKWYSGIKLCDRWHRFENFIADMGFRPSDKHSIDRINGELGYSQENCRWATGKQQARNTKRNRIITYDGYTATLIEWEEITGIQGPTIRARIDRLGWSVGKSLTSPVRRAFK